MGPESPFQVIGHSVFNLCCSCQFPAQLQQLLCLAMDPTDLDWSSDWPCTCITTAELPRNHLTGWAISAPGPDLKLGIDFPLWSQPALHLVLILNLIFQFDLRPASAPGICLLIWTLGWSQLPSLGLPCTLTQGEWNSFCWLVRLMSYRLWHHSWLLPLHGTESSWPLLHSMQTSVILMQNWVNSRSYCYCHKGWVQNSLNCILHRVLIALIYLFIC